MSKFQEYIIKRKVARQIFAVSILGASIASKAEELGDMKKKRVDFQIEKFREKSKQHIDNVIDYFYNIEQLEDSLQLKVAELKKMPIQTLFELKIAGQAMERIGKQHQQQYNISPFLKPVFPNIPITTAEATILLGIVLILTYFYNN